MQNPTTMTAILLIVAGALLVLYLLRRRKRKGLQVQSFAPSTMKKMICGNGRASKEEVARVVVSKFPELKVYLTQDRKWKERYHQNMFDAVALGMMVKF